MWLGEDFTFVYWLSTERDAVFCLMLALLAGAIWLCVCVLICNMRCWNLLPETKRQYICHLKLKSLSGRNLFLLATRRQLLFPDRRMRLRLSERQPSHLLNATIDYVSTLSFFDDWNPQPGLAWGRCRERQSYTANPVRPLCFANVSPFYFCNII